MLIDMHVHCFPEQLARRAIPQLAERAGIPAHTDGTVRELRRSMRRSGITHSVMQPVATRPEQVPSINSWVASVQDDTILAFGSVHPAGDDPIRDIEEISELNLKGVKLHPDYQRFFVDDPHLFPIYEAIFDRDLPLLFHAGLDIGLPEPIHAHPRALRRILDRYPGARIIAAHMGGYQVWDAVEEHLLGTPILMDTSYSVRKMPARRLTRMVRAHGHDRVFFGTDSPWADQGREVSAFRELDLTCGERDAILAGNASRLLGLKR